MPPKRQTSQSTAPLVPALYFCSPSELGEFPFAEFLGIFSKEAVAAEAMRVQVFQVEADRLIPATPKMAAREVAGATYELLVKPMLTALGLCFFDDGIVSISPYRTAMTPRGFRVTVEPLVIAQNYDTPSH
jgi:hypothetical protein